MKAVRVLAGTGIAAGILLPVAWLSSAPLSLDREEVAFLRVSIGARPERIETCREQSDEELAKLAPQMRQRVICDGTTARYDYGVWYAGRRIDSAIVRGGGLRNDRRLYVFREYRLPPGAAAVRVRLQRIDTVPEARDTSRHSGRDADERDEDERDEDDDERGEHEAGEGRDSSRDERERSARQRRQAESVPARLELDLQAVLRSRAVLLVTYDQNQRKLVLRDRD